MMINIMKHIKPLLITVLLIIYNYSTYTQQTVKVITKTISRDVKFAGQKLTVKGEKSEININGWTKDYIKIEINLISKNPSAEVASNDLDVLKYKLLISEEEIFISNLAQTRYHLKQYLLMTSKRTIN